VRLIQSLNTADAVEVNGYFCRVFSLTRQSQPHSYLEKLLKKDKAPDIKVFKAQAVHCNTKEGLFLFPIQDIENAYYDITSRLWLVGESNHRIRPVKICEVQPNTSVVESGLCAQVLSDRNLIMFESGRLYRFIYGAKSDVPVLELVRREEPKQFLSYDKDARQYRLRGYCSVFADNGLLLFSKSY